MKKTEKKSLEVIESKKMVQYTLKMNLQDLEKDMKELTRLNEAISQIIRTEYDAGRMH